MLSQQRRDTGVTGGEVVRTHAKPAKEGHRGNRRGGSKDTC